MAISMTRILQIRFRILALNIVAESKGKSTSLLSMPRRLLDNSRVRGKYDCRREVLPETADREIESWQRYLRAGTKEAGPDLRSEGRKELSISYLKLHHAPLRTTY